MDHEKNIKKIRNIFTKRNKSLNTREREKKAVKLNEPQRQVALGVEDHEVVPRQVPCCLLKR
jgi:hypothetical protein